MIPGAVRKQAGPATADAFMQLWREVRELRAVLRTILISNSAIVGYSSPTAPDLPTSEAIVGIWVKHVPGQPSILYFAGKNSGGVWKWSEAGRVSS